MGFFSHLMKWEKIPMGFILLYVFYDFKDVNKSIPSLNYYALKRVVYRLLFVCPSVRSAPPSVRSDVLYVQKVCISRNYELGSMKALDLCSL